MNIKWEWFFAGIFFLLFGLFNVTNIEVTWGRPIMGFSALIAGVVALLIALRK